MALALGPATPAGKRPLDAELNLVPFIDLLVCCVCFLLITAVWVQLSSVHARAGEVRGGERTDETARVSVLVGSEGYTLNVGSERLALPRLGRSYDDAGLARRLESLHASVGPRPLLVAAEDGVPFRQLIQAMDVARRVSFTEITVSDSHGLL